MEGNAWELQRRGGGQANGRLENGREGGEKRREAKMKRREEERRGDRERETARDRHRERAFPFCGLFLIFAVFFVSLAQLSPCNYSQ